MNSYFSTNDLSSYILWTALHSYCRSVFYSCVYFLFSTEVLGKTWVLKFFCKYYYYRVLLCVHLMLLNCVWRRIAVFFFIKKIIFYRLYILWNFFFVAFLWRTSFFPGTFLNLDNDFAKWHCEQKIFKQNIWFPFLVNWAKYAYLGQLCFSWGFTWEYLT